MEKISIWSLLVDGLCLAAVGIPILVIKYSVNPTQRGFYCSDSSLYYPYHSSTVPTSLNVTVSYGVAILLILARQTIKLTKGDYSSRWALGQGYRDLTIFLFGVFTVQMVSGLCKVTAGRLRPHFLSVCQPTIQHNATCGTWDRPEYVTNFTCLGNPSLFPSPEEMESRVRETRLSFLSGHASLSWYGAVFSAGYLRLGTSKERSLTTLPSVLTQVLAMVYAVLVSISRVTDNKHHPGDVVAGALLGLGVALLSLQRILQPDSRKENSVHNRSSSPTGEEMISKIS